MWLVLGAPAKSCDQARTLQMAKWVSVKICCMNLRSVLYAGLRVGCTQATCEDKERTDHL